MNRFFTRIVELTSSILSAGIFTIIFQTSGFKDEKESVKQELHINVLPLELFSLFF